MSDHQPDNPASPPSQPLATSTVEADKEAKPPTNLVAAAELSASASSLASVASSKASVSTTKSGIRPPSKIGRLCGDQHKPPVPMSPPRSNETDDPLKKFIDEFGRHRLTDVLEEDAEEDQSGRPWNGFINRKRFSSNSSAILTEDTDSFIIGDRVWVGGTKPGHIAFIGETQFAPGEWAGIALDEPIGKNDGSVGGIRYFMCEAKKGVFARLTRLTRAPLAQDHGGSGDTFTYHSPLNGGLRKSPLSPSPTESHRSVLKSPVSVSGSTTSLSPAHIDYKIADRVIIKSGQGSKVGTVRFMGQTEFAPGEWVGVELDEPRGKNDGSVNGIRYFECQPNFGLFAPISKVSKSPSKIKPNQCQVHSPTGGLPPSGMKRANSKESMASNLSMLSSASATARRVRLGVTSLTPKKLPLKTGATPVPTRTALQDVLKEKQQHIEQLLKERDLERAEITRAASQADEAEHKFSLLNQEYAKYRTECEAQLQEHLVLLAQLKESRNELVVQLEDEKKRNEDWQFKFEEAEITRADLEISNDSNLSRIKELEESLTLEREKAESLEAEANKIFEAEENLARSKEEVENLKKELQEAKNRHVALEGDSATTTVLITSLQHDLDQTRKDCDEKSEVINVLKQEISNVQTELESFKKKVELGEAKLKEADEKFFQKGKAIEALMLEVENINKVVSEKNKTIEQLQADNLSIEDTLHKELDRLKMELSSKVIDCEAVNDKLSSTEAMVEDLKRQLEASHSNLDLKSKELQEYQSNLGDMESKLKENLEQLQSELKTRIKQGEEIETGLTEKLSKKEVELAELFKISEERAKMVVDLNKEIEILKNRFELSLKEITDAHKKEADELKKAVSKLSAENESYQNDLLLHASEKEKIIEELTKQLSETVDEVQQLRSELENLTLSSEKTSKELEIKLQEEIGSHSEKISQLSLELQEKTNQHNTLLEEMNKVKSSLENKKKEYDTLIVEHEKSKSKLEEELKVKVDGLQQATEELAKNSDVIHSLQTELQTTKLDLETVSKDLLQYQTSLSDVEAKLKKERDELHESLKLKMTECDNLRKELSDIVALKDKALAELSDGIKEKSEMVEKLKNDLVQQKDGFEKMMNELIENQKKELKERDESISQRLMELSKKEEEIVTFSKIVSELESAMTGKNAELDKLNVDIQKAHEQNKTDSDRIKDLTVEVENLNVIKTELESKSKELEESKETLQRNKKQWETELSSKSNDLTEAIQTITAKDTEIEKLTSELNSAKAQCEKLSQEIVQYQNNLSDVENSLRQERDSVKEELNLKVSEVNKLTKEVSLINEQFKIKTNETENVIRERDAVKLELEVRNSELQKLKEELSLLNNNLEGKLSDESTLKQQVNDLKMELTSKSTELFKATSDLSKVAKDLEEKLAEANNTVAEKTKQIHEKEDQVTEIHENQKKFINQLMEDHKAKLAENNQKTGEWEQLVQTKSDEINRLNNAINQFKTSLSARDVEVAKLDQELAQLKTHNAEITSSVSQTTKTIEVLEKESKTYQDKLEALEKQLSQVQLEKEALDKQVQQTASNNSSHVAELEKKLLEKDELIKQNKLEIEKVKAESEKIINDQNEKMKATEHSESLLKNIVAEMQTDVKELPNLKTNVNSLQGEISKRDITIASKDTEIMKLKDQLTKAQNATVVNGAPSDNVAKSNGSTDYKQLLEEKIFAENQVAFLNSIIVDMQKKNEEQKARIEILEMGYSPAAAEELKQLGFKTDFERQAAPRMYCDICEEFDLHETEDCPAQASDEPVSNSQLGKEKKAKPPPRPYCEICGEFGHDTADCTDDQEF